jgi:hypothetical protein
VKFTILSIFLLDPWEGEMNRQREKRKHKFAVYGTQGGGLVREIDGKLIFIEKPCDGVGLDVGDEMPEEWGIIPANDLAREEAEENWPEFEQTGWMKIGIYEHEYNQHGFTGNHRYVGRQ